MAQAARLREQPKIENLPEYTYIYFFGAII